MSKRTIIDFFQGDHERLDKIFKEFQSLVGQDPEGARSQFENFKEGLLRHIRWEEEILFPRFEARTGQNEAGPTVVMRMEHRQIQDLLEKISQSLGEGTGDGAEAPSQLLSILGQHNLKEENVLYPYMDRLFSEEEITRIFSEIDQVLPEISTAVKGSEV